MKRYIDKIANDDNKMKEYKTTRGINKPIYTVYNADTGTELYHSDSYADAANYIDSRNNDDTILCLQNNLTGKLENV